MKYKNNRKAIILLSGGIDSSTSLAIAQSEGYTLYTLSFDYNQRHKRELKSAEMVASSVGVQKHLVIQFDLREIGGSALTSEIKVPRNRNALSAKHKIRKNNFIPVTYVPARNTIFLSFALAWAEVLEAENIFIGANAIDYSGYPDCRPEYLTAFEAMANVATKASVEGRLKFKINAPLISMKKSEIIRRGVELGLDYSMTWSCYDPQTLTPSEKRKRRDAGHLSQLIPCGRCDSCIFRAKGFREAGMRDPLFGL
jgi:7-cyano-7-deazaguanine synthase